MIRCRTHSNRRAERSRDDFSGAVETVLGIAAGGVTDGVTDSVADSLCLETARRCNRLPADGDGDGGVEVEGDDSASTAGEIDGVTGSLAGAISWPVASEATTFGIVSVGVAGIPIVSPTAMHASPATKQTARADGPMRLSMLGRNRAVATSAACSYACRSAALSS